MSEHPSDGDLVEVRRAVYRPLRRGNALEDAVARLVQTIRLGVVAPGESLPPERELAASFGVSRDTVREAIRELADTGYLVPKRGRYGGTFIADPLPQPSDAGEVTADEIDDVLGLRRAGRWMPRPAPTCGRDMRPRCPPGPRSIGVSTRCCTSRSRRRPASPRSSRWSPRTGPTSMRGSTRSR